MNGIVYAMGGGNPSLPQPVDAYNPATDTWSTVSQMPTSREGAGVAALNGLIYVAGGNVAGGVPSGILEAYDPASNTWNTSLAPMTPRAHLALVAAGGKLYAMGGHTGPSNSGLTGLVERYDPVLNQWTTLAPMTAARAFFAAGALNSDATIVVAGGAGNGPSTELYTVATNSWTLGPAMLSTQGTGASAVVNNALFVFGSGSGSQSVQMFRPAGTMTSGWAGLALMPTSRGQSAAAVVGDVVYVMGGLGRWCKPVDRRGLQHASTWRFLCDERRLRRQRRFQLAADRSVAEHGHVRGQHQPVRVRDRQRDRRDHHRGNRERHLVRHDRHVRQPDGDAHGTHYLHACARQCPVRVRFGDRLRSIGQANRTVRSTCRSANRSRFSPVRFVSSSMRRTGTR